MSLIINITNAIKRYAEQTSDRPRTIAPFGDVFIDTDECSITLNLGQEAMDALQEGTLTAVTIEDEEYIYTIKQK